WETSDVLWGANSATVASKALRIPLDYLLKQLGLHLEEMAKEGRRNASGDQERINTIAKLAIELGADNVKLADEETAAASTDDGKTSESSRAADTPALTANRYRLQLEVRKRVLQ